MERHLAELLHQPVCVTLRQTVGQRACHIVGGALRDRALGVTGTDLDLVVAGDGEAVAERLADRLEGRAVKVGGQRFAAYRIVSRAGTLDLWDRGNHTLESDLRRRDLTIHSFALDLTTGALIDPFAGVADLLSGTLRMTTREAFAQDPLRILRLCRFAAQLDRFRIDSATRSRAWQSLPQLSSVASERIRQEIELTLALPRLEIAADLWIESGILPGALVGLSTARPIDDSHLIDLPQACSRLRGRLDSMPASSNLARASLALILLHLDGVLGLSPLELLERLRQRGLVTRARAREVAQLLGCGPLPDSDPELRWYLHRADHLWPEALALFGSRTTDDGDGPVARAVQLATAEPQQIFDPPPLVTGDDLRQHLRLPSGPRLGRIVTDVRRRQIEGTITSRAEALELAGQLLRSLEGP